MPDPSPADQFAMRIALDQALNAQLAGEVPVGAVVMRHGQVIATGYNRPITTHDPSAHAEIVALRHAAELLGNYRLPDCEVFVTLEPCPMCAMALIHARVRRVVFGCHDPKGGAAGSVVDLFAHPRLNHHTTVTGGLLAVPAAALLRAFFAERRAARRAPAPTEAGQAAPTVPVGDVLELPFEDAAGAPPHPAPGPPAAVPGVLPPLPRS